MSAGVQVAHQNGDFLSERDYNHVSDQEYIKFRDLARKEQSRRQELSAKSQQAYRNGDKQEAHEFSVQAKQHGAKADEYNDKAADYVFRTNNLDSDNDEIDLHGLFVKEAEEILKKRINYDLQNGRTKLEVIVGKGNHSKGGVAKIKPSVQNLCQEAGLECRVDSKNTGVLIIDYTHSNPVPHWPTGTTHTQQPGYQQQPHYNNGNNNNHNNNNNNNNNGGIANVLLQIFCMCVKNYSK